jgi:hypothetical protein
VAQGFTVEDLKTGPKESRSTVLTEEEEAAVVAFRRHTLLPLDACLYALQPDTVGAASLPAAAWHLASSGCRGRQAPTSEVL